MINMPIEHPVSSVHTSTLPTLWTCKLWHVVQLLEALLTRIVQQEDTLLYLSLEAYAKQTNILLLEPPYTYAILWYLTLPYDYWCHQPWVTGSFRSSTQAFPPVDSVHMIMRWCSYMIQDPMPMSVYHCLSLGIRNRGRIPSFSLGFLASFQRGDIGSWSVHFIC